MRAIPPVVQHLLYSHAGSCLPKLQRGYGHSRRARTPGRTVDVDGTRADYGLCLSTMLDADDACIVSRSPRGLAKIMEVIMEVCRPFALTASVEKTELVCMPPPRTPRAMMRFEAAGQFTNSCNPSPAWGPPLPKIRTCPLISPGVPTQARY